MNTNNYRLYAMLAAICCINSIFSANTTWTWVGGTVGNLTNWTTKANWSTTDPDATIGVGDTAVINSGQTNYPVLTAAVSIARLRMNGGTLDFGIRSITCANGFFIIGGAISGTSGNMNVTSGGFSITGGSFTGTSGDITVTAGGLSISGATLTVTSGSIAVNGGGNLNIGTGGTLSSTTGAISVTGNFNLTGSGTLSKTGTGNVSVSLDLDINTSGSFSPGTGALTVTSDIFMRAGTFTKSSGNVTASNGNLEISGGSFTHTAGVLSVGSDLIMTAGTFSKPAGNINVTDDGLLSGGTFGFGSTSSLTFDMNGDFFMSGGILNAAAGQIDINDSMVMSSGTLNTTTATVGSANTNCITLSGGTMNIITGALDCADLNLIGGTLNISGDKLVLVNDQIEINGTTVNVSTTNLGITDDLYMMSGTLDLNGFTVAVTDEFSYKGGSITDPSTFTVSNLIIDHTGLVTLPIHINIVDNATFNNGVLVTSASAMLIMAYNSNVSGADATSHIAGPVRKEINSTNNTSPFVFPIGNGKYYAPITISSFAAMSAGDFFTAQYDKEFPPFNRSSKDNSLDHVSAGEYWVLDRGTSGGANTTTALVGLRFDTARSGGINNTNQLRVARWDSDSSKWKDHGAGSVTGTIATGGVVTSAARVTRFSPFTLGSTNALSPLPVQLLDFTAKPVEKQVKVSWATTSEVNNDFFTVQRSLDGKTWSVIGIVDGVQNSDQLTNYTYVDRAPVTGVQFYRLIQTDLNGKSTLSNIAAVNFTSEALPTVVAVSPNPTTKLINVNLNTAATDAAITVYNMMGVKVMEMNNLSGHSFVLDLSALSNGIYTLEIMQVSGASITKILKN